MGRTAPHSAPPLERLAGVSRFFEFSLLGLLASGYLALAGSGAADLPSLIAAGFAIILRTLMAAGFLRFEISDRAVMWATLCYAIFYPIDYARVSREFLPSTVHLVFFLAIAKVLTARTNRDFFFLKLVAFLELLAASVVSTSPNYFLFLALFLLFGVATFASSEIRRSAQMAGSVCRAGLRGVSLRLSALSLLVTLGVLVMSGGFFFVLPRTARAAFQRLAAAGLSAPGFSSEVRLGRTGEYRPVNTPAMHIRIQGLDGQTNLKWRGGALGEFDGRRWYNSAGPGKIMRSRGGFVWLVDSRELWRVGRRISYEVVIQSLDTNALFLAGIPQFVRLEGEGVLRSQTDAFRTLLGSAGVRYYADSYVTTERHVTPQPEGISKDDRVYYTLLPPFDSRILELARSLGAGQQTDERRAWAIEDYLRRNFGYTTEMLPSEVPDPLAHFLFERRKGHCEYFASAMVVMLRAIHIPARVATGFQSGLYNPVSGWHIVRAGDAHTWVEAYIPQRGWITFDPTPPAAFEERPSLWSRLLFFGDAAETFWQDWVLNYDLERQVTLAARMEQSSHKLRWNWFDEFWNRRTGFFALARASGIYLLGLTIAALLAWKLGPVLLSWWWTHRRVQRVRRGDVRQSDATLLYQRMLRLLRKRGIEKPAWQTPAEFARRHTLPYLADFTAAYNELRFGGDRAAAGRLVSLLAQLESTRP